MHQSERIIAARLLRELEGAASVALGAGLPEQLLALAPGRGFVRLADLNGDSRVEVAVVQALEVSQTGDLLVADPRSVSGVRAGRWIVAGPMVRGDGQPVLVKSCHQPPQCVGCVSLVIHEYGVVRVSPSGFELVELAPGSSSDDVRLRLRVSLHVADDISVLRL